MSEEELHKAFIEPTQNIPAQLGKNKVILPQRELKALFHTEVLVAGGGSAGVIAAIAAARCGVDVAIIDRYGHFGGLWTGGMVLTIFGTHVKENNKIKKVVRGIGDELLARLSKLDGGIIDYGGDLYNPTVDPEATKYIMDEMLQEADVNILLHNWAVNVIMDGNTIKGVICEGKSGTQAITAKIVVDATGDGDILGLSSAHHRRKKYAIGMGYRIGNIDTIDEQELQKSGTKPHELGLKTPIPGVNWFHVWGPEGDCLNVTELTKLEMFHRQKAWNRVQNIRQTPGYEKIFLMDTAPQLGVRISRLLSGTKQLTFKEARQGRKFSDVIAVGGSQSLDSGEWPIPYGVLVPEEIDNLLATGRCISVDDDLIDDMRVVPTCLLTGHAAGAAAAVAIRDECLPRDIDIAKLQKTLIQQDAYLGK